MSENSKQETQPDKPIKPLFQVKLADYSGAGYFRNLQIMQHLGHKYMQMMCVGISPYFNLDPALAQNTQCYHIQRDFSEQGNLIIKHLKEMRKKNPALYTFRITYELDDYIFGKNETHEGGDEMEAVPSYSSLHTNIKPGIQDYWCIENMKLVDEVTVTTEYLAKQVRILTNHSRVKVIPISISNKDFGRGDTFREIPTDISKPTVLYCGAPCHYGTAENQKLGDFSYGWVPWIKRNVEKDKINFVIMGGLPFFLEDIKEKIRIIPGMCIDQYIPFIRNSRVDFVIAPLTKNKFNMAKSDLKLLEATNMNAVLLGSWFNDEKDTIFQGPYAKLKYGKIPYKASEDKIDEKFWDLCKKDMWLDALKSNKIACETRWTEHPAIESAWMKTLVGR